MNEHVSFSPTENVVEFGQELVPVFVQDSEDYPSDDSPFCAPTPEFQDDEDFDDCDDAFYGDDFDEIDPDTDA